MLLLPLAVSGCGDSPTAPVGSNPSLTCPADIDVESPDDGPVVVSYATPVALGGTAPVTVSCTPASLSLLPVGQYPANCLATDARTRTASCSFRVRVRAVPRLQFTRFLAFGDSLTSGVISPGGHVPAESYPTKLEAMLAQRYRRQTFTMTNVGFGGEVAAEGGRFRFRSVLAAAAPQVLLLMEGTNDLFFYENQGVVPAISALSSMIGDAQRAGVRVMLATIPPQRAGGLRQRDVVASIIPRFNDEVRALAARQGAGLVDVYGAVQPQLEQLIGPDDLHPNPQGYLVIAQRFFEAIQTAFELPNAATRVPSTMTHAR